MKRSVSVQAAVVPMIVLVTTLGAAGEAPPWTLDRCLAWGLSHHPSLAAIQAQIEETEAARARALSLLYPKVSWVNSVTGQRSSFGGASALFATAPRGSINPSFFSEWTFGTSLGFQQTAFPWDRVLDSARALEWTVTALRASQRQTEADLRFQIVRAFAGVLLMDHLVKIAREGLLVAEESERTTQGLFKEGRSSELEVQKAKVQRLNAAASALEAESQSRLARENLQLLVVAPSPFEVTGALDTAPVSGDLSVWEAKALAERPEVRRLQAQRMAAQAGVEAAAKAGWPTVSVAAGYTWLNDQLGWNAGEWYKTWNVGVNLLVPIFDGGASVSQEKEAQSKLAQVEAAASLAETQVKLEVRQAWMQLTATHERLAVREEQVKAAEENWRIARDRYRLGLVSWLELKDAELALTGAKTQLAQTKHDYMVGRAALERAAGVVFPTSGADRLPGGKSMP